MAEPPTSSRRASPAAVGPVAEVAAAIAGTPSEAVRAGPIDPAERAAAIARLVGQRGPAADRLARRFDQGRLSARWCWAARGIHGGLDAVVLAAINPGRTATLLLSPIRDEAQSRGAAEAIRLLSAALLGGDRQAAPVDLVQTMLEPHAAAEVDAVLRGGLRPLASLRFMERPAGRGPTAPPSWPPGCTVESWTPSRRGEVLALLERTYEGTLDCPGLAGLRAPEDVLAGHLGAGRFDPRLWSLLRRGDTLEGLALLNPNPEAACTELVYLGMAPSIRGGGLAARLLQHALSLARPFPRVALAVDDRNLPALRLYRRAGFEPGGLRRAFIASGSRAPIAASAGSMKAS